jgi:hypothetical protein
MRSGCRLCYLSAVASSSMSRPRNAHTRILGHTLDSLQWDSPSSLPQHSSITRSIHCHHSYSYWYTADVYVLFSCHHSKRVLAIASCAGWIIPRWPSNSTAVHSLLVRKSQRYCLHLSMPTSDPDSKYRDISDSSSAISSLPAVPDGFTG